MTKKTKLEDILEIVLDTLGRDLPERQYYDPMSDSHDSSVVLFRRSRSSSEGVYDQGKPTIQIEYTLELYSHEQIKEWQGTSSDFADKIISEQNYKHERLLVEKNGKEVFCIYVDSSNMISKESRIPHELDQVLDFSSFYQPLLDSIREILKL